VTKINSPIFCPSTDITESTHVLGVVGRDGKVKFLEKLLPLPRVARDEITMNDLRDQVRLTGLCIQKDCAHWKGICGVGKALTDLKTSSGGSYCDLKLRCRWLLENGPEICSVCQFVTRGQTISSLESKVL
jgi:hypothetical protein